METVFIDPNEIAQEMAKPENSNLLDHIARGLSEILDVSTDFVYKQASDKAFRYKVIRRKIPEELADEVRNFVSENEIKGVYLETDAQRYYPYSSLAAQVMGFVSTDNVGLRGPGGVLRLVFAGHGRQGRHDKGQLRLGDALYI